VGNVWVLRILEVLNKSFIPITTHGNAYFQTYRVGMKIH